MSRSWHALRLAVSGVAFASAVLAQPIWPQWAQNAPHTGAVSVVGQSLDHILADIIYDPLVPAEQAANGGDLLAHYQATRPGRVKKLIFQQLAIGAAYTPASIDNSGRIYSQNDGHLFVVGN